MNKIDVFLIDDSEVDTFITKQHLAEIEVINRVTHFESAQAALDFILDDANHEKLPDLMLLDISMPVIDGFEFLDELAESEKFPADYPFKIILLSNSKNARDHEKFEREYSVIKFVKKPVSAIDLEMLIAVLFKN